jgi:hypothetical protein
VAHCAETRRVRRELDKELVETGARSGRSLLWTAADREVLTLIASAIDRKCDLQRDYSAAKDPKTRVKISAELRLIETAVARLLKQVHTDTSAPESQRTIQARAAVMRRWHPDAAE